MGFRAQAVCLHVSNQDDVDRICKSTHQLMHGSCLETSRLRVFGGAVNFVVFFFWEASQTLASNALTLFEVCEVMHGWGEPSLGMFSPDD